MSKKYWRDALASWSGELEFTYEQLPLAALMSIRDELRKLNSVMQCHNVSKGFSALAVLAKQNDAAFKRRVDSAVRKRLKRAKP